MATGLLGAGPIWVPAAAAGALISYVVAGLIAARAPLSDIAALRSAPRFILHKLRVLGMVATNRAAAEWRRTERG